MKQILIFFFSLLMAVCSAQQFNSPYKLSLTVDVPLSSNALGFLGASYLIGSAKALPPKESLLTLNHHSVNAFDRLATYQHSKVADYSSDALLYLSMASPLLHLINKNSRHDFGKISMMSAEVFVLNIAITNFAKETVRRKRPFMYDPDIPIDKKYKVDNFRSFFSGHTSTVAAMGFFFAKTFSDYNPHSKLKPMVWSLCAVLPAATGILRVYAGKHFWTDVITGYAVGALCGLAVPYLHSAILKINKR